MVVKAAAARGTSSRALCVLDFTSRPTCYATTVHINKYRGIGTHAPAGVKPKPSGRVIDLLSRVVIVLTGPRREEYRGTLEAEGWTSARRRNSRST